MDGLKEVNKIQNSFSHFLKVFPVICTSALIEIDFDAHRPQLHYKYTRELRDRRLFLSFLSTKDQ